jgi:hypothetical protein
MRLAAVSLLFCSLWSAPIGRADGLAGPRTSRDLTDDLLGPMPSDSHPDHRAIRPQGSINLALPASHLKRIYDSNGFGDCAPQPVGGIFAPSDWSEAGQTCLRITQDRYNSSASRHFSSGTGAFGVAQHPSTKATPAVITTGITERILEQSLQGIADSQGAFLAAAVRGRVDFSFSLFASDQRFDSAALARNRRPKPRYVVAYGEAPQTQEHGSVHVGRAGAISPKLASAQPLHNSHDLHELPAGAVPQGSSSFAPRPVQKHLIEIQEDGDGEAAAESLAQETELQNIQGVRYHLGRSLGLAEPVFSGLSGKIERDPNGNFYDTRVAIAERAGSLVFSEIKPFYAGGPARSLAYGLGLPFGSNRISIKNYVSNQPSMVSLERRLVRTNMALSFEPRTNSFKFEANFLL